MKEIEILKKDTLAVSAEKQVEKKRVLIGSAKVQPNHRCFEINVTTLDIKEADVIHNATFGGGVKKSVDIKENCAYILAMNKANALKKYNKIANG